MGIGGTAKVASVPQLDKFLNHDKPVVMVHGHNGFFGITLYDSKAERFGWWVHFRQLMVRSLTLKYGYTRWSNHEAPEKPKSEWLTFKEQTLSEVGWTPYLDANRCLQRRRCRSSNVTASGLSQFLKSLRLQRPMILSFRFGPVTKLINSSIGIRAGWS